jgi:hypothetical protein
MLAQAFSFLNLRSVHTLSLNTHNPTAPKLLAVLFSPVHICHNEFNFIYVMYNFDPSTGTKVNVITLSLIVKSTPLTSITHADDTIHTNQAQIGLSVSVN